jgi:hypothetical protein
MRMSTEFNNQIVHLPQYKMTNIDIIRVKEACVDILDVKDLGELRDRFEGQKYLDNKILIIGSYLATMEFLRKPKPLLNKDSIKKIRSTVDWNGKPFDIITCKYLEYPKLTIEQRKAPKVFIMQISENKYCFLGVGTNEIMSKDQYFKKIDNKYEYFIEVTELLTKNI